MTNPKSKNLEETRRPIASLISKSAKARQKLTPGTWQHAMLGRNLKALRIASALFDKETRPNRRPTRNDLQEAFDAFASMISRTEKAYAKFPLGTSHHTLQRNRLAALCVAEALITAELRKRDA